MRDMITAGRTSATFCPKIGARQWTCTRFECTCHLKETIALPAKRVRCKFDGTGEYNCATEPCIRCAGPDHR